MVSTLTSASANSLSALKELESIELDPSRTSAKSMLQRPGHARVSPKRALQGPIATKIPTSRRAPPTQNRAPQGQMGQDSNVYLTSSQKRERERGGSKSVRGMEWARGLTSRVERRPPAPALAVASTPPSPQPAGPPSPPTHQRHPTVPFFHWGAEVRGAFESPRSRWQSDVSSVTPASRHGSAPLCAEVAEVARRECYHIQSLRHRRRS